MNDYHVIFELSPEGLSKGHDILSVDYSRPNKTYYKEIFGPPRRPPPKKIKIIIIFKKNQILIPHKSYN